MKFKVFDDYIEVVFVEVLKKEVDQVELANRFYSKISELYKNHPEIKYKILLDITDKKLAVSYTTTKSFLVYRKVVMDPQTDKMAILTNQKFMESIVDMIFEFVSDKKANWFTDKKKAKTWLGVST